MKPIFTSMVGVLFLTFSLSCQAGDLKTYSSSYYTLQYPQSYAVTEPNPLSKVLVVKGTKGRVEIFKTSDFGNRLHGFSSSGQEEFEAKLVPKEKIKKGEFEVWLFYTSTDEKTKEEVQGIARSFKGK